MLGPKKVYTCPTKINTWSSTETCIHDCKPAQTSTVHNHHLPIYLNQVPIDKDRCQRLVRRLIYLYTTRHCLCDPFDKDQYQRLVRRLSHLSHTRTDIAYAISLVSQFMHDPSENHMTAVVRILSYLKRTLRKGLTCMNHGHVEVEGYINAYWVRSIMNRLLTYGYFTFLAGNLVTWWSRKQNETTRSSLEAKYRDMVHGALELLWFRLLLREIGVMPKKPTLLYCENNAAWEIANNSIQRDWTKYAEVYIYTLSKKSWIKSCWKFPLIDLMSS